MAPLRIVGIVLSAAWIIYSALNFERVAIGGGGGTWLGVFVALGLPVGLFLFGHLMLEEGRARERAKKPPT